MKNVYFCLVGLVDNPGSILMVGMCLRMCLSDFCRHHHRPQRPAAAPASPAITRRAPFFKLIFNSIKGGAAKAAE